MCPATFNALRVAFYAICASFEVASDLSGGNIYWCVVFDRLHRRPTGIPQKVRPTPNGERPRVFEVYSNPFQTDWDPPEGWQTPNGESLKCGPDFDASCVVFDRLHRRPTGIPQKVQPTPNGERPRVFEVYSGPFQTDWDPPEGWQTLNGESLKCGPDFDASSRPSQSQYSMSCIFCSAQDH